MNKIGHPGDLNNPMKNEGSRYGGYRLEPAEASGLLVDGIPHGARVLDVGCGDGTLSLMLRDKKDADVIGLEPNRERADAAASRGVSVFQMELSPALSEKLGLFDVVMFADVLEHIPDPAAVLKTAAGMLRPGGIVLASVPNVAHWTVRLNLLKGKFEYTHTGIMDSTHLRWYTRSSLIELFNEAGYSVDGIRSSAGVWIWDYKGRRPWRWLAERRREELVRWMALKWPTAFGYQHVVKASPK